MSRTTEITISIPRTMFDQAQLLAQRLNISAEYLVEIAVANFLKSHPDPVPLDESNKTPQDSADDEHAALSNQDTKVETPVEQSRAVINQGDIYWLRLEHLHSLASSIPHPHVVVQDNVLNHSRIHTVVVCGLTSNLGRASIPGNVLLEASEGNLPRQSIVEVSKVSTVEKTQLGEYIGFLSGQRIQQIFAGMRFLQRSFFER